MHPGLPSIIVLLLTGALSAGETPLKLDLADARLPLVLGGIDLAGPQAVSQAPVPDPADIELELEPTASVASKGYARKGSTAWWLELGMGTDFNQGWTGIGGVGVEWYPVDDFALGVRADGIGIELRDTDVTYGGGVALLLRWHVLRRTDWSLYFDGGCGIAYFSGRVPSGAAHLNFTPQLGIGFSFACDDGVRLLVGTRWFHVSNGQTGSSNPGVDMLNGYVGISMPF